MRRARRRHRRLHRRLRHLRDHLAFASVLAALEALKARSVTGAQSAAGVLPVARVDLPQDWLLRWVRWRD